VDVELPVVLPPAIVVPADAVLDSGLKKTVFVDRGNGLFEPREVETGWRFGGRVEIVRGLKAGEQIVISGNFLIDSESRLELAAAGMYGTLTRDPVCGMSVSIKKAEKAGMKSLYRGKTFYFCSNECKRQFDQNPDRYQEQPTKSHD
jgi:YHS domain-containing protein